MSWRIADNVVRGEIDCRQKGVITGTVWLQGRPGPVRLSLTGLPLSDLAGCLLTFTNPAPRPGPLASFHADQQGPCGVVTASRKVPTVELPLEKVRELARLEKEIPTRQANEFYLEWFSERNGRVVITSTHFTVLVSAPLWRITREEEARQEQANREALRNFLDGVDANWVGPGDEDDDLNPDGPVDEFEWERMLKDSDAKSDKLGDLMQKYDGHPDSERLVAREMGWSWVEDELDAEERGLYDDANDPDLDEEEDSDELEDLQPNPLTEGRDWIRDDSGDVQHPLCYRTFRLGMRMWRYADEFGLLADESDRTVADMVINAQICSAKLAGALNDLAYDLDPEPGLVVASLKRALHHLHIAMRSGDMAKSGGRVDAAQLEAWRREFFEVREEILRLMNEHRQKLS